MTAATPRLIHSLPGRARVHVPGWSGLGARELERQTCRLRGVTSVRANPTTRNLLVHFDSRATDQQTLLDRLSALTGRAGRDPPRRERPATARRPGIASRGRRARIALRGLERDPGLARRVVERLEAHPEVARVAVSLLTERVLVELVDDPDIDFDDVASLLAELEPAGDESLDPPPPHPLDPAPLIEGSAKLIGSGLGLGLLLVRRLRGAQDAPVGGRAPAEVAAVAGIIDGLPALSSGLERALGHEGKEVLLGVGAIVSLTFSGSTLGLALAAANAARTLAEARAKRAAWKEYEQRSGNGPPVHPGAVLTLQAGDRAPLPAQVLEGFGSASRLDGSLVPVMPGVAIESGARVYGGPLEVRLDSVPGFPPPTRSAPPPSAEERYVRLIAPVALAAAVTTAVVTRSLERTMTTLLLITPRPAVHGTENANRAASQYVMRSGATVVGTRARRPIRRPDVLLLDAPRVLADGMERSAVETTATDLDLREAERIAATVSAAAGSPWGDALAANGRPDAGQGDFDGRRARATVDGADWSLAPATALPRAMEERRAAGELVLQLSRGTEPVALFALRPRLAPGLDALLACCRALGVGVEVVSADLSPSARSLCERAGVPLIRGQTAARVRHLHRQAAVVAVLSDGAHAAEPFAWCDLAIARTSGRRGRFAARADLLVPGLDAVRAVIDAGSRRDAAVRDSVGFALASNVAGAVWGVRGNPTVERGSTPAYIGSLAAIADGTLRLRGGRRSRSIAERLTDPMPERMGRQSPEEVMRGLGTSPAGLTDAAARKRWRPPERESTGGGVAAALLAQLRSPLTAFLGAGALLAVATRAPADVVMIGSVLALNAAVSVWQEHKAGSAGEALAHLTSHGATVLRDAREQPVLGSDVVPGDVLVLKPGDRVAADARLIDADRLEVDESALTGESLPVEKTVHGGTDADRIVLDGSDVTVGSGRAVATAVGSDTRMGALGAALTADDGKPNPLDERLSRILRRGLPLMLLGGGTVTLVGTLRGLPLLPQLAVGAAVAIAAVPEGLPLLAGVAEAGVGQRLARRRAVVTRLAAVEALGRVDVACADKTGTMTEGTLAVALVSDTGGRSSAPEDADAGLREVLLAAALASPGPDAPDAGSHPTDIAVTRAAEAAGLGRELRAPRRAEVPFDPARGFHATATPHRLVVKGAAEVIAPRCRRAAADGTVHELDDPGRARLLEHAERLAGDGHRVLLVAEGSPETSPDDPRELTALGFISIRDPLRAGVPAAVERCRAAGVRVIMLTGDHPATAAAIARDAGLIDGDASLITGPDLAALDDAALAERLEDVAVIARTTPLDKLRIVSALQRGGHVVAMTGDGVNDAPALRLADVGVAMGRDGTEVARQAADLIITDDDFSTLVEALVEGRGFWRNMRQAIGLLLGGNLGEVGLMVAAALSGLAAPMSARQILAVNVVTDVLPAVSVAVQAPEHRDLAALRREGAEALDASLRGDVIRRGVATAAPAFGAYAVATRLVSRQAPTVAFASIVTTQLAQTLAVGRAEAGVRAPVTAAVAGSAGLVGAALYVPQLRALLGLAAPNPLALALVASATLGAVIVHRALAASAGSLKTIDPHKAGRRLREERVLHQPAGYEAG